MRVVGVLCALARLFAELALGEELVHGAENADERARVRERLGDADGDEVLVDEAGAGFEGDGGVDGALTLVKTCPTARTTSRSHFIAHGGNM